MTRPGSSLRLRLRRALDYLLSLPERRVRTAAALTGGVTGLLAETLLPSALRNSNSYLVTVGLFQEFLSTRLGGVEADERQLRDRFVERKVLGNVLEAAGLLTMRLSPLWVLALAGDAIGSGRAFMQRLAKRLEANGVIADAADISAWEELFEALQSTASAGALAIDQPPLSRSELGALGVELRGGLERILGSSGNLLVQLTEIWDDMEETAEREGVEVEQIGGAMALDASRLLRRSGGAVRAVGESGVLLLDEAILDSYRTTLEELNERGLGRYLDRRMRPFVRAAHGHFDPGRRSWTERWLNRRDDGGR
jgi:hypothetical protein